MKSPSHDRTMRSRYECKYLVEESTLDELRGYFRTFLAPDRHAAGTADGRYCVNSLYVDSPRLNLYRDTLDGAKNRYKLRLRCYDDDPGSPIFVEVKKRMDGIVYKRRAPVSRSAAKAFIDGDVFALERDSPRPDTAEFALLARNLIARPTIRVRYWREAYESSGADPVRATFDTELRYAHSSAGETSCVEGEWGSTRVTTPILEIKFTNTFPGWLADLVRQFGLVRRSVAKYVICMNDARRTGIGRTLYRAG